MKKEIEKILRESAKRDYYGNPIEDLLSLFENFLDEQEQDIAIGIFYDTQGNGATLIAQEIIQNIKNKLRNFI